jgi:hypothetical protein
MSLDEIYSEVTDEFEMHLTAPLDHHAVALYKKLLDKTVGYGHCNHDIEWKEPVVSYVLHHYGKIARMASKSASNGTITEPVLHAAADSVIRKARIACDQVAKTGRKMTGPLCGGWDT